MDDSEKLSELRVVLDDMGAEVDDEDSVLLSFLSQAKDVILNRMYPYMDEEAYEALILPKRYEFKQIRIAAYLLNKRGAEGEIQHIENGIHRNYKNADVPAEMLVDIMPRVGIPK